jgi:hypothetical protein
MKANTRKIFVRWTVPCPIFLLTIGGWQGTTWGADTESGKTPCENVTEALVETV